MNKRYIITSYIASRSTYTNDSSSNELAQDGKTELLGSLALHQEDGSSTVRDLGSITGSGATTSLESRLEFAKDFNSRTFSDTLIGINNDLLLVTILIENDSLNRGNFFLEEASLLSSSSLGVREGRELILGLARDVPVLSNILRRDTRNEELVNTSGSWEES